MNWSPPDWIRAKSHQSMDDDVMSNHYSHPRGRPRLIKALSKHYSPQFENIVARGEDLRPEEIVVTAGANCGESARLRHSTRAAADSCRDLLRARRPLPVGRGGHPLRALLRPVLRL